MVRVDHVQANAQKPGHHEAASTFCPGYYADGSWMRSNLTARTRLLCERSPSRPNTSPCTPISFLANACKDRPSDRLSEAMKFAARCIGDNRKRQHIEARLVTGVGGQKQEPQHIRNASRLSNLHRSIRSRHQREQDRLQIFVFNNEFVAIV
jgi:hypothetical protein